jgi:flagellar biosynthetic protein FliP
MMRAAFVLALWLCGVIDAAAQTPAPDLGALTGGAPVSGRIVQMIALLTVLSLAPGLLIMTTSFTRFVVAFSFLRSSLGLQSTPANLVLMSLSLFMTFYVMGPTFDTAWRDGVKPLMDNAISEEEAYAKTTAPFRVFMSAHVREKDLRLFESLSKDTVRRKEGEAADLRILAPAFMISELRRGFEIGFMIALPFLVIDMVVATLTMAMGMMMLPPSVIALPLKVLFFVLIDGWSLVVGSLVRSYG